MRVRDVMTRYMEVVLQGDTVDTVAQKMKRLNVGVMPVYHGGEPIGIITDRDITIRVVAEGHDPTKTSAADIMTPDVVFCKEDDDVREAADIMRERQIRRLLVMDGSGTMVGIVSLGDLASVMPEEDTGEVIRAVSEPTEPQV